jgi:hypothetical protein
MKPAEATFGLSRSTSDEQRRPGALPGALASRVDRPAIEGLKDHRHIYTSRVSDRSVTPPRHHEAMECDLWDQWTSAWRDLFDFDVELQLIVSSALEDAELDADGAVVVERARAWEQLVRVLLDVAESGTAADEVSVRMLAHHHGAVRRALDLCEFATS